MEEKDIKKVCSSLNSISSALYFIGVMILVGSIIAVVLGSKLS